VINKNQYSNNIHTCDQILYIFISVFYEQCASTTNSYQCQKKLKQEGNFFIQGNCEGWIRVIAGMNVKNWTSLLSQDAAKQQNNGATW
jgi:hypothetical protein